MSINKMKAIVCEGYGGVEVLSITTLDKPIPKADELLIRICATTVNSGDVAVRALKGSFLQKNIMKLIFGWNKPRNPILGTNYAGVVEQVGRKVSKFKVSDEVFGLRGFKFGTHAEFVLVKENSIISHKPSNASFEEATAILFGGQTSHYFFNKSKVSSVPGLSVLIYGTTGSVGTAGVQIAKHYKAKITAVCSDYNADFVLKLGANKTIHYNRTDFAKTVDKYDMIFDAVGKTSKKQCSHILKEGGEFFSVAGINYARESMAQIIFLKELFEKGTYDACIDTVYLFHEIIEAHLHVETCKKRGNVVLNVSS